MLSRVVLNNNENEKMLGPHALLCVHALEGYSYSFTIVRTRTLLDRETFIMFITLLL